MEMSNIKNLGNLLRTPESMSKLRKKSVFELLFERFYVFRIVLYQSLSESVGCNLYKTDFKFARAILIL